MVGKKNPQPNQAVEEMKKLEDELSLLKGQLVRALADYQNLEKRVASDREGWVRFAGSEIVSKFLPILDTLKLVLKNQPGEAQEGLAIAIKQFENVLEEIGVDVVATGGKVFNPETMECVETVNGDSENQIAEELATGYTYNGRLLRPAKVKVYKKKTEKAFEEPKTDGVAEVPEMKQEA